jgi:hypothetical protein
LEHSDAVFYGTVKTISSRGNEDVVVFDVLSAWKGATLPQISIHASNQPWGCGVKFEIGQCRLVYASYAYDSERADNYLFTYSCIYLRPRGAKSDLEVLGPGTPPLNQDILAQEGRVHEGVAPMTETSHEATGVGRFLPISIVGVLIVLGVGLLLWLLDRLRFRGKMEP